MSRIQIQRRNVRRRGCGSPKVNRAHGLAAQGIDLDDCDSFGALRGIDARPYPMRRVDDEVEPCQGHVQRDLLVAGSIRKSWLGIATVDSPIPPISGTQTPCEPTVTGDMGSLFCPMKFGTLILAMAVLVVGSTRNTFPLR